MLSSSDIPGEAGLCETAGIACLLRKPVKQSELFNAIVSVIDEINNNGFGRTRSHKAPDASERPARILKVLIAEDHPVNQKLITEILRERGHFFAVANNGVEALDMLEQDSFDVVLMDGQMPELDGYEATAEIRKREKDTGKHVHIIALTALAMESDRERCLAAGMDDYLSKPVDPDLLLQLLESTDPAPLYSTAQDTPDEKATGSGAFDIEAALSRVRGKRELLKRLAHLFLREAPGAMASIRTAVGGGDLLQLEQASHRLKGAASTISASTVAGISLDIERMAKTGELRELASTFRSLEKHVAELTVELEVFSGDTK